MSSSALLLIPFEKRLSLYQYRSRIINIGACRSKHFQNAADTLYPGRFCLPVRDEPFLHAAQPIRLPPVSDSLRTDIFYFTFIPGDIQYIMRA